MKLPGIDYNRPFDRTTKPDISRPLRAHEATARAIGAVAEVTQDIMVGLKEEEANKQYADTLSELNGLSSDIRSQPADINMQEFYDNNISDIRSRSKENLSDYAFKLWDEKFTQKSAVERDKLLSENAMRLSREQREVIVSRSAELSFGGDLSGAREIINNSLLFSDEEKKELLNKSNIEAEKGAVEKATYSGDVDIVKEALDTIKSNDYDGSLKKTDRSKAVNQLTKAYKELTEGAEEQNKLFNQIKMVNDALSSGTPLNRTDPDTKKAVNAWFDSNPSIKNGVRVTVSTNVIPKEFEALFRRYAFIGDPKVLQQASNAYEVIERYAPHTLDNVGVKEKAIMKTTTALYRAGVPLPRAVEIARKNATKTPEETNLLDFQYKTLISKDNQSPGDRLVDKLNSSDLDLFGFWRGAPNPSPALRSAYMSLEREYYKYNNGDIVASSDQAFADFERLISLSEINDRDNLPSNMQNKRLMAWAPSKVYGIPDDYLKGDLARWAKKRGIDRYMIVSDVETARDPMESKSYAVYRINQFGNPEPIKAKDENGIPERWIPDVKNWNKTDLSKQMNRHQLIVEEMMSGEDDLDDLGF